MKLKIRLLRADFLLVTLFLSFLLQGCTSDSTPQASNVVPVSINPITWINQLGSSTHSPTNPANANLGNDICNAVTTDSNGNIYCAGGTDGNLGEVNANPGSFKNDAFIMKTNSSGQILWITQLGATTHSSTNPADVNKGDEVCNGVAVDSSGNVFCAGSTDGNLGEINAHAGNADTFIMKVNSSGALQWVRQLGAATHSAANPLNANYDSDFCSSLTIDISGDVYCGGHTYGNVGEVNAGGGGSDSFVMKINSAGVLQWVTQLGVSTKKSSPPTNANQGEDHCYGITYFNNAIYCAGDTAGNLGEVNGGNSDAYIMKLDSDSGSLTWIRQMGETTKIFGLRDANLEKDICRSVAADKYGNVYCGGSTYGNLGEINSSDLEDAFIMKVSSDGNLKWVTQLGQETHSNTYPPFVGQRADVCMGIAADDSGNVYCGGYTSGNFGEVNAGTIDSFVMKLNYFGELQWVKQLGITTKVSTSLANANSGDDYGVSLALNSSGDIFLSGFTYGNIGELGAGGSDMFILKLNGAN